MKHIIYTHEKEKREDKTFKKHMNFKNWAEIEWDGKEEFGIQLSLNKPEDN